MQVMLDVNERLVGMKVMANGGFETNKNIKHTSSEFRKLFQIIFVG